MDLTSRRLLAGAAGLAVAATLVTAAPAGAVPAAVPVADTGQAGRYLVTLDGTPTEDGFRTTGSAAALRALVATAGATVANDLSAQIGVLVVSAGSPAVMRALTASPLVDEVGADWRWDGLPDAAAVTRLSPAAALGGDAPEQTADPLEPLQWDMAQISAPEAHDQQAGRRSVRVGILDSGIDGNHPDFVVDEAGTNVDCALGHNSVTFLPTGPGVGNPDPCIDNQFHGTHVAGTVAAQANGIGIVGVAPNVTLVPVKVCDASGYCYASSVVDGITYSGQQRLDVLNMSFYVDDDEFQESTEFKCTSDPEQRAFKEAVNRALAYAVRRGATPVAALGNSDQDLANPRDADGNPIDNECEVVPAESPDVIGVASVGNQSEKAAYSNYGYGPTDVTAPGGNGGTGDCTTTILSTLPGGSYGCIQGTSMASPHAAGVAALIVSQFNQPTASGDVFMAPADVASILTGTSVDIGLAGYDECFGNGRIDAARAVANDTSAAYDATAPPCPEYAE
jgi:subtilisin family serine protease